jgi:hypothetical protein
MKYVKYIAEERVYIAAFQARNSRGDSAFAPCAFKARNKEEAFGKAHSIAIDLALLAEGWYDHRISVKEVPLADLMVWASLLELHHAPQ